MDTATLKNHRNEYEYQVLVRLADMLPADINVCVVADRGFGDQKLYRVLTEEWHFNYVIRFRGNRCVSSKLPLVFRNDRRLSDTSPLTGHSAIAWSAG